jgi:hypothetical protein
MRVSIEVGETLVVFERDRPGGDVENESAESAVVIFPAVV